MDSISSRIKSRVELFGEKTMWMWFSVFHLILECMECGEDWKWNNVSVNVESLYSTLEIIQQGRKEVFGCFCCLFTWNYPSRCKNSTTHWELIQWSGFRFAWWNRNCWIGWRWLVVCLDFGDSTGNMERSHLIGEIDGEVEWWWKGVDLNEWVDRIRCSLISLWHPLMIVQFTVLDESDFIHFAWKGISFLEIEWISDIGCLCRWKQQLFINVFYIQ